MCTIVIKQHAEVNRPCVWVLRASWRNSDRLGLAGVAAAKVHASGCCPRPSWLWRIDANETVHLESSYCLPCQRLVASLTVKAQLFDGMAQSLVQGHTPSFYRDASPSFYRGGPINRIMHVYDSPKRA